MSEIVTRNDLPIDTPDRQVTFARKLSSSKPEHIFEVAQIIQSGGIVAFPFNGVFGLFGDIDNIQAAETIIVAKGRPKDKKLIAVTTPESIDQLTDLNRTRYSREGLVALLRDVHALGVILPASAHAPSHLTVGEEMERTILTIWTEYSPLRRLIEHVHSLGGRGLVGTSANKFGEATHFDPDSLYEDFKTDLPVVVYDRFDDLPLARRRSTTIIDLTNHKPRLHREGNVSEDEIREALRRHNFPELWVGRDVISVRGRTSG